MVVRQIGEHRHIDPRTVETTFFNTDRTGFQRTGLCFGGSEFAGTRFSVAQRDSSLPTLEPGESAWTYDVMSRSELAAFLGPWPELAAYAQSADPVPKAPSADIELRFHIGGLCEQGSFAALRAPLHRRAVNLVVQSGGDRVE